MLLVLLLLLVVLLVVVVVLVPVLVLWLSHLPLSAACCHALPLCYPLNPYRSCASLPRPHP
jgi:hypothetical protein